MRDIVLIISLLLVLMIGYGFIRRLDIRLTLSKKRKQKLKNSKILTGDDPDD